MQLFSVRTSATNIDRVDYLFIYLGCTMQFLTRNLHTGLYFPLLFDIRLEVLTVVWIHNAVWVRKPYSLVFGCESFRTFWVSLHRSSEDERNMLRLRTSVPTNHILRPHNPQNYNLEVFVGI
jgi:hypothetical protein